MSDNKTEVIEDAQEQTERDLTELVTADTYQDMTDTDIQRIIDYKEQCAYDMGVRDASIAELQRADNEMLEIQAKAIKDSTSILKELCSQQVFLKQVTFDNAEA